MWMLCRLPDYGVEGRADFGSFKRLAAPIWEWQATLEIAFEQDVARAEGVFSKAKRIRADIGSVEKSWAI